MSLGVLLIQFQLVFSLSLSSFLDSGTRIFKKNLAINHDSTFVRIFHTHPQREREKEWERRWRGSNNRIRKLTLIRIYKSPSSYERKSRKVKRNHWQKGRFSCWKLDSSSSCPSLLFLFVCVCVCLHECFVLYIYFSLRFDAFLLFYCG